MTIKNKTWSEAEIARLRQLRANGINLVEISRELGRTVRAVENASRRHLSGRGTSGASTANTDPLAGDERIVAKAIRKATEQLGAALAATGMRYENTAPVDASLSPFERQMRALERGARLVANDRQSFGFPGVYKQQVAA